jgi:hypothetical protein
MKLERSRTCSGGTNVQRRPKIGDSRQRRNRSVDGGSLVAIRFAFDYRTQSSNGAE